MTTTILHPTDFSAAADRALGQIVQLAKPLDARVHVFHKVVYPLPRPPSELLEHLDEPAELENVLRETLEGPVRDGRSGLDERLDRLASAGVRATGHLERSAETVSAVEDLAAEVSADLIVMGTHGRTGAGRWLMGSVAEKLLRHAPCDVMTLHEHSPIAGGEGGFGEILVPTDFSDGARRALDEAFELTSKTGASICLLHVIELRSFPLGEGGPGEWLRRRCEDALRKELAGRDAAVAVAQGDVVSRIGAVAEERGSAWIVVGTHGRTGLGHMVIGSTTEKVVRFSGLPVLTVR